MSQKKILVVDDDPVIIRMLEGRLNENGYELMTSLEASEGLQLAMDNEPDLIVLDVMLPKKDGFQVAERIRKTNEQVPIIFLTATTDNEGLVKCIESGGDDFLTKPYSNVLLRARIDAFMRIRNLYNIG